MSETSSSAAEEWANLSFSPPSSCSQRYIVRLSLSLSLLIFGLVSDSFWSKERRKERSRGGDVDGEAR